MSDALFTVANEMAARLGLDVGDVRVTAQELMEAKVSDKFMDLDAVLDGESWEWLSDNCPPLAESVRKAVAGGVTPEQIRARVLQRLGTHRMPLAQRCEAASRHLQSVQVR